MITLAQAQQRLSQQTSKLSSETVLIAEALGRVASEDVFSSLAIPPSDNSAMDGFAVNSNDVQSGKVNFRISQRIPAGANPQPLIKGAAARIFTGGLIPAGADAVVIQENCDYTNSTVTILSSVNAGANVRLKGQDIKQGAKVIHQGQTLNAIDISLLASIGCTEIKIYKPITVALFSTGDELIEPGQALLPGQIYNSNRPLLVALCQQLGYRVFDCGIVEDNLSATKAALAKAAQKADVIISSGGVSVGEEDYVKPAVEDLGELALWKVKMKPGKPVAFGNVNGVPFIGLPGNPVSSFTVFQLLAKPLLSSIQGQNISEPQCYSVIAGFDKTVTRREEYIRVKLSRNDQSQLIAERFPNLSSGVMSSLSWADGLVRQPIDSSIKKNQTVDFFPLRDAML